MLTSQEPEEAALQSAAAVAGVDLEASRRRHAAPFCMVRTPPAWWPFRRRPDPFQLNAAIRERLPLLRRLGVDLERRGLAHLVRAEIGITLTDLADEMEAAAQVFEEHLTGLQEAGRLEEWLTHPRNLEHADALVAKVRVLDQLFRSERRRFAAWGLKLPKGV